MSLRGIDLPNLDTLRLLWRQLRGLTPAPDALLAAAPPMPELWYPFVVASSVSQYYNRYHPGVDWPLPTGTALYAMFGGQVVQAGKYSTLAGYAYRVAVQSNGWGYTYGHMLPNGINVRVGQWVSAREYLGRSDNTGNSTGPHLHAGVYSLASGGDYGGGNVDFYRHLKRWSSAPPPQPPPSTGNRYRTIARAPIVKKKTGKIVGYYPAGAIITVDSVTGNLAYAPAQLGQLAGYVDRRYLVKA